MGQQGSRIDTNGQNPASPQAPRSQQDTVSMASAASTTPLRDTPKTFYDMVLSCRLSDLCCPDPPKEGESVQTPPAPGSPPGFWKLEYVRGPGTDRDLKHWKGHVVGVLGQYNRGKTWIMSRLSNYKLPTESMVIRTDGIAFKWITTKDGSAERWHLAIDTAGFNTPITLDNTTTKPKAKQENDSNDPDQREEGYSIEQLLREESQAKPSAPTRANLASRAFEKANSRMQETEEYEQFLGSMTLGLSNYVIVVMNETTLQDQKYLFTVVRNWKAYLDGQQDCLKCRNVFVVHNFKSTTDVGERMELFKQSTEKIFDGVISLSNGVRIFSCPSLTTRHVCLMNDSTDDGSKYNDQVFQVMKDWIHNILQPPAEELSPTTMADRFAQCATDLLKDRGYITNVTRITRQIRKDTVVYFPEREDSKKGISLVSSDEEKFYSTLSDFRPTFSVSQYKTKAGSLCKMIQIEAPGVTKLRMKDQLAASVQGNWAFEVSGNKKKTDINKFLNERGELTGKERLLPADIPDGLVITSDSCRYGKFHETFQVELNFKKQQITQTIGPVDGIFYLLFEEEEKQEVEDSSSDEDARKDEKQQK